MHPVIDAFRGPATRRVVATFTGGRCWTWCNWGNRRPARAGSCCACACSPFCGGLLLLLSSRPAGAAERREPQLLDPVAKGLCGPVDGRDHGLAAAFAGFGGVAADLLSSLRTDPARPAADGASSPVVRSIRSWPALTGAVSLPGSPASAELRAGGPDPLSSSSDAGVGLAALTAAPVPVGLMGHGRARPDRSGVISRSYLPLVSPA
jgi:hypothetical protein